MGAMKPGPRPGGSVTNARKVPACGEAVNDELHTARGGPLEAAGRPRY